jgi:hydroxyethylthiazole kinase-like uncharacterized protein yjeF
VLFLTELGVCIRMRPMLPLLSSRQMKEADRYTIEILFVPEIILMEHAALGVVEAMSFRYGAGLPNTRGVILAGPGNNGGDALAVARILSHRGCTKISVVLLANKAELSPLAATQLKMLGQRSVPWAKELNSDLIPSCDWVIDGIFGTGLSRAPEGAILEAMENVNRNARGKWVVAIDIPSGLLSDTGNPIGCAIRASETVTLGFYKRGLVTGQAADYVGKISLAQIQIPRELPDLKVDAFLYTEEDTRRLPDRRKASHKGNYGHVYLWAGQSDKQGASSLAALAALRAGAGLVTLFGEASQLEKIRPRLPSEVMTMDFDKDFYSAKPGQIAGFGPGMGTDPSREKILQSACESDWNLVLDADALTLAASMGDRGVKILRNRSGITILTPHPKEAARLLGCEVGEIERDRFAAIRELTDRYQASVVLKGKGTLITVPGNPVLVVTAGDTGLSKGGTGDVLTGIIASLLAQKIAPSLSLPLSAYIHGRASELCSQKYGQERSTLASEIAGILPDVFKEIECRKQT